MKEYDVKVASRTVIRKLKRPATMYRWPAYAVSRDRYGLWLYSPKGSIHRGQVGAKIGECKVGSPVDGVPVIQLIPHSHWWTATWCREANTRISVDICTPPILDDDEWTYTDLELDPLLWADGHVDVDDEDEFAASCEAGLISDGEAASARSTTVDIVKRMQDGTEPFGLLGWERLDEALSLALPPITTLSQVPVWHYQPDH
jgi:hypothetical protein